MESRFTYLPFFPVSLLLLTSLFACTPYHFPVPPTGQDLEKIAALSAAPPSKPADNWPLPPTILPQVLAEGDLEIVEFKPIGSGITKPYKVTAHVPEYNTDVTFKWKTVPKSGDDVDNSPRKEIVADLIQRWFLDPDEYVVPTSTLICMPTEKLKKYDPEAEPNIPGTRCVLGNASAWLENLKFPKRGKLSMIDWFCTPEIYDKKRFMNDAVYARSLSNMNLLTYLIQHRDGRCGNFMISTDPSNYRIYSIDNGISFDSFWYRNYGTPNWESIFVPAFRKKAIDRLRKLTRKDLDSLGVAIEMRADENGILRIVPEGKNMDPSKGARIAPGRVQFGLKKSEIDGLEERIKELLDAIDQGRLATF
jgi:hypothetical protein